MSSGESLLPSSGAMVVLPAGAAMLEVPVCEKESGLRPWTGVGGLADVLGLASLRLLGGGGALGFGSTLGSGAGGLGFAVGTTRTTTFSRLGAGELFGRKSSPRSRRKWAIKDSTRSWRSRMLEGY